MSTKIGLPVPMPMLLPVTGTALVPFSAYFLFLSLRITYHRLSNRKYVGTKMGDSNEDPKDPLYCAYRSHSNYAENLPLALALCGVAELNGASRKTLAYSMTAFFVLRVLHAEFGMMIQSALGLGRILGYYGTQTWLTGMAIFNWVLVKDYWTAH
ncbi:hypothetical protein NA57DRAFT_55093 [Rhizodiscina lignyota]|uniref:Membrane-associated proteins in eicosanoid and glutathione metabolism n=1 Tax=Rhizodiscina lignyota TaxID=1504668 RepID=A0A9P4IM87_9PEZI|nr:hypothetical protein NA57DRAFT_55093 [Rhizodiscina lignyota]